MTGYMLTFYSQQSRSINHIPVTEWLVAEAKKLGLKGATILTASEGLGKRGKIVSAGFFDLADQPVQVSMACSEEDCAKMLARVREENVNIFYTKSAMEFGYTLD